MKGRSTPPMRWTMFALSLLILASAVIANGPGSLLVGGIGAVVLVAGGMTLWARRRTTRSTALDRASSYVAVRSGLADGVRIRGRLAISETSLAWSSDEAERVELPWSSIDRIEFLKWSRLYRTWIIEATTDALVLRLVVLSPSREALRADLTRLAPASLPISS